MWTTASSAALLLSFLAATRRQGGPIHSRVLIMQSVRHPVVAHEVALSHHNLVSDADATLRRAGMHL